MRALAHRARVARARAREGAARSRKIFARFHFLHISVACARDARSRAGIARERARSRGARARCASARRKILRDRPSEKKINPFRVSWLVTSMIYNILKYLICSIKDSKITMFAIYITLKFFSVVDFLNLLLTFLILALCPNMVIFRFLIEHNKYLRMLYIPHEMRRGDVSNFYTHSQSYKKVFGV